MFFSLIQTLVCVLLVNGGLYALHLTGSSTNSNSNAPASNNGHSSSSGHTSSSSSSSSAQMKNPSLNPFQTSSSRFNEELADLAQLERERLMVMGLAKQTAEESGYHGRPIITGRIKMHPVEDLDSDYSAWLSQQARNVMFGSVVKQPTPALMNDGAANDDDYDTVAGGVAVNYEAPRRPTKYDYGRVVQPVEREFETPHTLDLDDFMELESVADEEDRFPDMDGYAYLEDLMAEENKERMQRQQAYHQNVPKFPGFGQQAHHSNPYVHSYPNQEHLEMAPQALQELFDHEQQQHSSASQHRSAAEKQHELNAKYRNNIRVQQKWQRKRAQLQQQQQPQLPRNIFGQKNKQQHYFKTQSTNKFSLANSEATATSKVNNQQHQQQQQQQHTNDNQVEQTNQAAVNKTDKASTTVSAVGEQQKPDQMLHPNHKRSGVGGGGGSSGAMSSSAAAVAAVASPHSLANQLMLRSARGQRQYDVPQIECPTAMDGMERFACPTPDVQGRYRCIDDHVLCDGFIDCPEGEDEDRRSCMFYKTTKAHLDVLADALLRWARGR